MYVYGTYMGHITYMGQVGERAAGGGGTCARTQRLGAQKRSVAGGASAQQPSNRQRYMSHN